MSFFKKLFGKKTQEETTEESKEIALEEVAEEEKTEEETEASPEEGDEKESKEPAEEAEELEEVIEEESQELVEEVEEEIIKEEAKGLVEESAKEDTAELAEGVAEEEIQESTEEKFEELTEEVIEEEAQILGEELTKEEAEELVEASSEEDTAEEVVEEELEVLEESEVEEEKEEEGVKKKGFFGKLFEGLTKTRDQLMGTVDQVLKGFTKIDEELYEELEEVLIHSDFGVETTMTIIDMLRNLVKERRLTEPEELKNALKEIITDLLTAQEVTPIIDETKKNVILVIGVNGVGKTTSIGKLANQFNSSGKKVVLAAADTFRAAAIEQLGVWADRAGVDLIKHQEGTDPAAVVFDSIQAAKARKADILICDTAGRLQNKVNLMKELEKINRIIEREYPEAHKEVLIVLDATTGQNALSQVKVFKEVAKVDGIILTKLDGTAKGGAVVGICESLQVPVKYIGVGEQIEDLQVFDPKAFADALFAE